MLVLRKSMFKGMRSQSRETCPLYGPKLSDASLPSPTSCRPPCLTDISKAPWPAACLGYAGHTSPQSSWGVTTKIMCYCEEYTLWIDRLAFGTLPGINLLPSTNREQNLFLSRAGVRRYLALWRVSLYSSLNATVSLSNLVTVYPMSSCAPNNFSSAYMSFQTF